MPIRSDRCGPWPDNSGFWLRYWTATYAHVLASAGPQVLFVDFGRLVDDGRTVLSTIAEHVGLEDSDLLLARAADLQAPTTLPLEAGDCRAPDLEAALNVYAGLRRPH